MRRFTLNKSKIFAALISIFAIVPHALGAETKNGTGGKLEKANEFYTSGDCAKAVEYFSAAQSEPTHDEATTLQIIFRKSYCQLNMGQNTEAESGFAAYLKKDPTNGEAQLRLAESQFKQNQFEKSRNSANKVKAAECRAEAMVFAARASLELNEPDKALNVLKSVPESKEWKPVVLYWQGVAHYRSDDNHQAIKHFQTAKDFADPQSWVKGEAQAWIDRINYDNRWVSGYLSLGYLNDSNVAQSATSSVAGGEGPPKGPPSLVGDSTTIKDTGYYLGAGVTLMPYTRANKNVTASLSYSSPYYSKSDDKTYDYHVYTWELASNFKNSAGDWWGLKAQYLRTFYDKVESEGYAIFSPYYNWSIDKEWSMKFEYAYNHYVRTSNTSTHAVTVSTYYALSDSFGLKGGMSSTLGKGPQATYTNTQPPAVASGAAFNNYTTYGVYAGFWSQIFAKLEVGATLSYYRTGYKKEDAPVPNGASEPDSRSDVLTQYSLDLNYPIIQNRWSVGASATMTKNKSSGYQGIPTYGSLTTYTYDRNYYLATTTVSF